jgi:hypothetical protein
MGGGASLMVPMKFSVVTEKTVGVEILAFAFFFYNKAHAFRCSYSSLILFIYLSKKKKYCGCLILLRCFQIKIFFCFGFMGLVSNSVF